MRRLVPRSKTCVSVLVALPLLLGAAAAPAQQTGTPTLRATSRNVILDVVVTDSSGNPVTGLTASDLVVTENGVPQQIHLAAMAGGRAGRGTNSEAAALPTAQPGPETGGTTLAVPPPAAVSGTRTILLLDEVNVQFFDLALARQRLEVFLRSPEARGQSIAILALTERRQILVHNFSTDTESLIASLRALPGVIPATGAGGVINGNVTPVKDLEDLQKAMGVIEQLGNAFTGSTERVNVVWITSGFLTLAKLINSAEVQSSLDSVLKAASNLFLNARICLYTVDPHGVQSESNLPNHNPVAFGRTPAELFRNNDGSQFSEQQLNLTSNQAVANSLLGSIDRRSGGRSFGNANFIDVPLGRVMEESNASLRVAYSPTDKNFDGGYRRIRIKVLRPGLTARTREGYYARPEPPAPTPSQQREHLVAALDSPFPYQALDVSGHLLGAPNAIQVEVAAAQIHWTFEGEHARADQRIALAAFSSKNQPLGSLTYDVSAQEPAGLATANHAVRYNLRFRLPPETARLRVAVSDRHTDQIGTAEIPLGGVPEPVSAPLPPVPPLLARPHPGP